MLKRKLSVSVESINIVGDGDKVLIATTGIVRYTVFKLSDPSRLIVDLPDVDLSELGSHMDVDNYFLKEITVESYGGEENIGRIIIDLKEGIDYDVKSGENSILVSLVEGYDYSSGVEDDESSDTILSADIVDEEVEVPVEESMEVSPAYDVEEAEEVVVEDRPAKTLLAMELSEDTGATVVNIVADGVVGNYTSFEIDDPSRVVVDLWGMTNASGWDRLNTGGTFIKAVRVGTHADKTRLVFDAVGDGIPPYRVVRGDNTLVIKFGGMSDAGADTGLVEAAEADMPDEMDVVVVETEEPFVMAVEEIALEPPLEIAPEEPAFQEDEPFVELATQEEPAPEPVYEPIGTEIERITFKRVGPKGRLTVRGSEIMEYTVNESKDKMTVLLDIDDTIISEELVRTLDATKLNTPVATISSYQESLARREVRVLVKLKENARYNVTEVDDTITIDFEFPPAEAVVEVDAEENSPLVMKEGVYTGNKIDLDMVDANITDVLRLLAEVSDLNIIASDDVKGTISLRLKKVPWDQAFDIILKAKGLGKTVEGNVVRVAPEGKLRQENEAMLAAIKAREKLESLSIKFVPINYAEASKLQSQVQGVLSSRGSVTSESRTNTLIIKDTQQGISSAVELIAKLDTEIPQVLIEARIVEASTSFARDLGIQWGADYQSKSLDAFGGSSTSGQTPPATTTSPAFDTRHGAGEYAVNLPATGTAGTLGALGFVLGKAGANPLILDLRLSAGETQGQLRTISRPRIVTMDNKEAKIEQGESIPFETTSASGTSTQFIDANLSLTVTPHITPDGSVLMKIKASRNSIGTFRSSSGEPSINKKETSTEVLVRDGETTVIGGIVVSDSSDTGRGIPYLKDIPVLGWMFKSKSLVDTQTELLIFITPTILKSKVLG